MRRKNLFGGQRRERKIGRNDPCPCGSGLKFKKCCIAKAKRVQRASDLPKIENVGVMPPQLPNKVMRRFAELQRQERERVMRYGEIRPQIAMEFQGHRFVAVGSKLHYSKNWKFFPDFLRDYVPAVFGKEWGDAELAKPEQQRHPVVEWRGEAIRFMNAQQPQPDGMCAAMPNGFLGAYMAFAYDLYTVQHNGRLDDLLLTRLKKRDQFQGARHELFAEATCLRAGFAIEHENERDGNSRHAEFTARHGATGLFVSVEAKSKHRVGVIAMAGVPQPHEKLSLRFGGLINDALAKNPPHPLVIFLDTNLPTRAADRLYVPQSLNPFVPSRIMRSLLERIRAEHNGADPYALLVFTNHPHHFAQPNEIDPRRSLLSVLPLRPIGMNQPQQLLRLHEAADKYGNIPNEFPANPH